MLEHGPETSQRYQEIQGAFGPLYLRINATQLDNRPPLFVVELYPMDTRMSHRDCPLSREQLRALKDALQTVVSNVMIDDQ